MLNFDHSLIQLYIVISDITLLNLYIQTKLVVAK